jgi:hypothetical protein
MALWLCYLDSKSNNTALGPTPKACGVNAWLLDAEISPDGLQEPSNWKLYQRIGAGLPFGLDCRLAAPFTPSQEMQVASQLAPWLVRKESLRLQERPLLILRGCQNFSHRRFGPKGFRISLNSALRRLGCEQQVLLLCCQQEPVDDADAVIESPTNWEERPADHPINYEVFLRNAHHRLCIPGPWRIPAVIAPGDAMDSKVFNSGANLYNEWLELESSRSEFWLQGSAEAPVLLDSWSRHQLYWREPLQKAPPPDPSPTRFSASSSLQTSWGMLDSHHLALLVHGFHGPALRRLLSKLPAGGGNDSLPDIDLYLTVPEDRYQASLLLLQELRWPRLRLFGVPNRGRDVAPFLLRALPAALANGHQQFVKVHTKVSGHLTDGEPWGNHLVNSLLCPDFLKSLADRLTRNTSLGLIAPNGSLLPCTLSLDQNSQHLLDLCRLYDIPPRSILNSRFIAGTMMAGRLEALRPLLQNPLSLDSFEQEAGQTDGTRAHAMERWIGVLAKHNDWTIEELPGNNAEVPKFGYGWAVHPWGGNLEPLQKEYL